MKLPRRQALGLGFGTFAGVGCTGNGKRSGQADFGISDRLTTSGLAVILVKVVCLCDPLPYNENFRLKLA